MPVSSSLKRNYSLPGAVSGDKRLLDIQAIKAALEAIDIDVDEALNRVALSIPEVGYAMFPSMQQRLALLGDTYDSPDGTFYQLSGISVAYSETRHDSAKLNNLYKSFTAQTPIAVSATDFGYVAGAINRYYAVGNSAVITSDTGSAWTTPFSFASTPTIFINNPTSMVAKTTTTIHSSVDGVNWVNCTPAGCTAVLGLVWNTAKSMYVLTMTNSTAANCIATSPDGITWTVRAVTGVTSFSGACGVQYYGGTQNLFLLWNNTAAIWHSVDGFTWTQRTSSQIGIAPLSTGSAFMGAPGTGGANASISADGLTWTTVLLPTSMNISLSQAVPGTFLLCASTSVLYTSTNGSTWVNRSTLLNSTSGVVTVNVGDGTYLLYGTNSAVKYSTSDFVTFTAIDSRIGSFQTYTGTRSVFFGSGTSLGKIFTSTNGGVTVTEVLNIGFNITPNLLVVAPGKYFLYATNGFWTSDDCETWVSRGAVPAGLTMTQVTAFTSRFTLVEQAAIKAKADAYKLRTSSTLKEEVEVSSFCAVAAKFIKALKYVDLREYNIQSLVHQYETYGLIGTGRPDQILSMVIHKSERYRK